MRWLIGLLCLLLFPLNALSETPVQARGEHALVTRFPWSTWTVPTMANLSGRFGAYFKTRVVIFNPTDFNYPIYATLYGPGGEVATRNIPIQGQEYLTWENFLEEVFDYTGAGAVKFDSRYDPPGGSDDFGFLVTAEVYVDSPNGRYTTVVMDGDGDDLLGSLFEEGRILFNPGVTVNDRQRVNVGVFNDSFAGSIAVSSQVTDEDGNAVETIEFNVPDKSWAQKPLNLPVENGLVSWSLSCGKTPAVLCSAYLWVVAVDNQSNDGRFFPAMYYDPPEDPIR